MLDRANCEGKTDEELAVLALENQAYYACLIGRYEQKLKAYISRLSGGNEQDIEDLLQDIFIKIYQNLNGFDSSLKFSSWAYRVAHNEIISHWRKRRARPQFVGGDGVEEFLRNIASGLDIARDMENKYLYEDISKVLEKMDLKYREVLILKFLEEKSYEEISDILRKPMGTVATLISRAKKQFKKEARKLRLAFDA